MSSITKPAWFKAAIKAGMYKDVCWVISCFCVTKLEDMATVEVSVANPPPAFKLYQYVDGKSYCYWDAAEEEFVPIMGSNVMNPLLNVMNPLILEAGDLPNVKTQVKTVLGNVIINCYMSLYTFGDLIPFVTGKSPERAIQSEVVRLSLLPNSPIEPRQLTTYRTAVVALMAFFVIASPTATKAALTISPVVLAKRDELLLKYKDQLDDPVIIADIEKTLVDLDIEIRKGDPSENFYMGSKKLLGIGRKKQYIMYGIEGGLDGHLTLIKTALSEGMDYENLNMTADASTAASQSRGLLTARGGEIVNLIIRLLQTIVISEVDCGSKLGVNILVTEGNHKQMEFRNMLVQGKPVAIQRDMLKGLIGQTITLRDPGYCRTPDNNLCETCCNSNLATRPYGVSTATSVGGSRIMLVDMKAMHGTVGRNIDVVYSQIVT